MDIFHYLFIFALLFITTLAFQDKLIVDCLNRPDNTGSYLLNTYFSDTSRGFRSYAIRGTCTPGSSQIHTLKERVGYVWIKGESISKAYFKITSQQTVNGQYMHETWSYKGLFAYLVSSKRTGLPKKKNYRGFPKLIRCHSSDGRNKNGYCELSGPYRQPLNTNGVPYGGTVYEIQLTPPSSTAFRSLTYQRITKGGAIYGQYWDYRNGKWNKDDCYTFTAQFSDGHSCEVTCPVKDFSSQSDAHTQASNILKALGRTPKYTRSWLRTIAINGGGHGSRAGANSWRKSMTINLASNIVNNAYTLFLHEGAHVGLIFVQDSQKWKTAQTVDPLFISSYAKGSPKSEDVSESYVPWLKVKSDPDSAQSQIIKKTIPNRLAVFDDLICSKYPNSC